MAEEQGIWMLLDTTSRDYVNTGIPQVGDKVFIQYKDNAPVWSGMVTVIGNKNQSVSQQYKSPESGADTMYSSNFFKAI